MPEPDAAPRLRVAYISCAEPKEIWAFAMDPASGALRGIARTPVPGTAEPSPQSLPMAVSPDRRVLHAALRTPAYPVTSYAIDGRSGALTPVGTATLADSMAYLATDRTGRHLLAASYSGARLTSNPIDAQGRVQSAPVRSVPTAPKAHSILAAPDNRFLYAAVLGGDHVMRLAFDAEAGAMTPLPPHAASAPGEGPRHLRFHPDGRTLFVANEVGGTVDAYAIDAESGRLTRGCGASLLPDGTPPRPTAAAADLQITPDGRFLYASVRSRNLITGFAIGPDSLRRIGSWDVPAVPRSLAIDPDGRFLLAAGLETARVATFAIGSTGALTGVAQTVTGAQPNWIEIIDLPG